MNRYNEFGQRVNCAIQIDTSNTALNKNDLDFSNGATVPQFLGASARPVSVFRDDDIMYSQKFDPDEVDEQSTEQINSRDAAQSVQGLTEF